MELSYLATAIAIAIVELPVELLLLLVLLLFAIAICYYSLRTTPCVFCYCYFFFNQQRCIPGEVCIQMNSEGAAYQASQQRHHHNMAFGKKQRCIEVFQISGEDINNILTE